MTDSFELTEREFALLDPVVRRVNELQNSTGTVDARAALELAHATGRAQGRLDSIIISRGLQTSDWRLVHRPDGTWHIERKVPWRAQGTERRAPQADPTPVRRLPISRDLLTRAAAAASVARDLEYLLMVLDRLIALTEEASADAVIRQALFSAAMVVYTRTRKPDRRQKYWVTDDKVASCGQGAAEFDRHIDAMRDKHIAHSINPFEKTELGVLISEGHEILGTAIVHTALTGWQVSDLRQWQRLGKCLLDQVDADLNELQARADNAARSLPVAELESQPPIGFTAPRPDEANRPRSDA